MKEFSTITFGTKETVPNNHIQADSAMEVKIMRSIEQAKKIYEICVTNAKAGTTLTYGEALTYLGYPRGVSGNAIRYGIELAWIAYSNLPILTSIVVKEATGKPSTGYPLDNWKNDTKRVFNQQEWPLIDDIDWDYVWKNRKELSNAHATRGYFG
jgi:hypothetical protein